MNSERIQYLVRQYQNGLITPGEWQELSSLLVDDQHPRLVKEVIVAEMEVHDTDPVFHTRDYTQLLARITGIDSVEAPADIPVRRLRPAWRRLLPAAAAAVFLFVVCGLWFVVDRRSGKSAPGPQVATTVQDVKPGKDGAILTLADGRQVLLDSMGNGLVATEDGSKVVLKNGQVKYDATGSRLPAPDSRLTYNTLQTPRGRQFQLVLPDGSKVWLNAASSITYPTVFAANERRVKITGEAYFEVVKDKQKPFRVDIPPSPEGRPGGVIEVLGTHFNINSYADEDAIRTTLLEGKVKVSATDSGLPTPDSRLLTPGQQAIMTDHITVTDQISIDQTMAWKNGLIVFSAADIKEVLRQVSRWYDVDIEYKGEIKAPAFFGEIPRTVNLSDVLKIIELNSKLRFTITGNKVTVSQP